MCLSHMRTQCLKPQCIPFQYIRGFPKVYHSRSAARIVSEQNKFYKKLPLTRFEPDTQGVFVAFTMLISSLEYLFFNYS